jgi:hypothetical protein
MEGHLVWNISSTRAEKPGRSLPGELCFSKFSRMKEALTQFCDGLMSSLQLRKLCGKGMGDLHAPGLSAMLVMLSKHPIYGMT